MNNAEKWLSLYDFPGYEVSNWGRVKKNGVIKKDNKPHNTGYLKLNLGLNGRGCGLYIHRAVWENFVQKIPNGHNINHKNGIKTDNRLENLECVTLLDNIKHYKYNLCKYRGEKVNTSKLTEQKVKEIRKRKTLGESSLILAKEFGVCRSTVNRLLTGCYWRHVV